MSKWAWLDDTEGGIIMRDGVEIDPDKILCFLNANDGLLAALKKIVESPHRYFEDKHGTYVLGVADGRRFCANIAKAAIANEE